MSKLVKGTDKKICGVCSGLADYFDVDTTVMRTAYICLTLFTTCFPGVLLYIILAIIMPSNNSYNGMINE